MSKVSVGFNINSCFCTVFPSNANCDASFTPNEMAIPIAIIQVASNVYFAIFPIDFKLFTNNFSPKISKKKKGIPKTKSTKIP